jgi:glycerol kinase
MPAKPCLLALDQGTTSSRALAFSLEGDLIASAQAEFEQQYPMPGWVEHDPEVIWATTLSTARGALAEAAGKGFEAAAIGLANQRETTLVWDKRTGLPVYNAIVWQDRRTAKLCQDLIADGAEAELTTRTGLVLDPYFSATKIAWILDHVPDARRKAELGHLAFGTVDSFLLWRLTGGRVHATDATNASRTALFNIHTQSWDDGLLRLFNIPSAMLPCVMDSADDYTETDTAHFGVPIPIRGVAGDQQAALIGQAGFAKGSVKSTYGTGAFMVLNTGHTAMRSANRLLSTVAYRLNSETTYALEGSVLSAGATVQWLRDGLGLFAKASEIEALAAAAGDMTGIYMVPAFTGLGAPYWDPNARAAIMGLTRGAGRAEIARAALDSTVYQTRDLLDAMAADGQSPTELRVDGGMAANAWFLQRLADILAVPVVRPQMLETTAFGAACLAGLGLGAFSSPAAIEALWRAGARTEPQFDEAERTKGINGWRAAVRRVRSQPQPD